MSDNTKQINPEDITIQTLAILTAMDDGASIGDMAGITKDQIESLYALAYNLYNSANFEDAHTVFQALCIYSNLDERFWMGLAGCRQAMKNYQGAIDAYGMASAMQKFEQPDPFIHAARCCIKLGKKAEAIKALEGGIALCKDNNPDQLKLKKTALALLDLLKTEKAAK